MFRIFLEFLLLYCFIDSVHSCIPKLQPKLQNLIRQAVRVYVTQEVQLDSTSSYILFSTNSGVVDFDCFGCLILESSLHLQ